MIMIRHTRILVLMVAVGATCFALADDDGESESHARDHTSKRSITAVSDLTYKAECSSCHMLYPPGLLPARSWQAMMGGLKEHFGENATLDKAAGDRLTRFLTSNAADRSDLKRSQKIARSISANDSPLRFTETLYFKRQHHEINSKVWQRKSVGSPANCVACHARAETGAFSEDEVRIPR
ncbi:MAG: diheme cytochrome c [Proteobacteria bacterium]|nr:diheme cytochrome c [Pseudomonadota bacterium]